LNFVIAIIKAVATATPKASKENLKPEVVKSSVRNP
jgi:hypothetical protein